MPMRVDVDLFEAARSAGATLSRSAAQQLTHWARIGRELEASPSTRLRDIQQVLAGVAAYDALGERDQAIVRAVWDEETTAVREELNLAEEFSRGGRSWTEVDERGAVIEQTSAGNAGPARAD